MQNHEVGFMQLNAQYKIKILGHYKGETVN